MMMCRAYANYQPGKLYTEEDYLTFQLAPGECSNYTAATYWNTYAPCNFSSLTISGNTNAKKIGKRMHV